MRLICMLLTCLLAFIVSCDYAYRPAIKKSKVELVRLPDKLEWYHPSISSEVLHSNQTASKFILFTGINVSCSSCILKLDELKKLRQQSAHCDRVFIAPVCTSNDKFELLKYLVEENKVADFDFPLLLDHNGEFVKLNSGFSDFMSGVSVLTDEKYKVLLVGNPVEDTADRQRFLEKICKLKD